MIRLIAALITISMLGFTTPASAQQKSKDVLLYPDRCTLRSDLIQFFDTFFRAEVSDAQDILKYGGRESFSEEFIKRQHDERLEKFLKFNAEVRVHVVDRAEECPPGTHLHRP